MSTTMNRDRCLALAVMAQKALQHTQPGRGCANHDVERIADCIQELGADVISGSMACSSGGLSVERSCLSPEGLSVHIALFDEQQFCDLPKLVSFKDQDDAEEVHAQLLAACEAAEKAIVDMWGDQCGGKNGAVRDQLTAAIAAAKGE